MAIKLISFWDFLHHQGNCTSRQVICRKTLPLLSLYSLNILRCSRLLSRLPRLIEKNTTLWNITRNPPFCYHLHGYSAKLLLFRKSQGVYLRPSRSCHVYLFILTIFRFLLCSSAFQCVLLLQREKQSQSHHFELFPRYTKDFDPGPLSIFSWSFTEN